MTIATKENRKLLKVVVAGAFCAAGASATAQVAQPHEHGQAPSSLASTYKGAPPRAKAQPGSACEIAERYVTMQGAGRQPELGLLFMENAEVLIMQPHVVRGREEVAKQFGPTGPRKVVPVSFIDKGPDCFMELVAAVPSDSDEYRLVAVNHFTVGEDGLVKRLIIYVRPNVGR